MPSKQATEGPTTINTKPSPRLAELNFRIIKKTTKKTAPTLTAVMAINQRVPRNASSTIACEATDRSARTFWIDRAAPPMRSAQVATATGLKNIVPVSDVINSPQQLKG